jgi:hypothetical protein
MGNSDKTVLQPTPEILTVAELLDHAISRFLDSLATPPTSGTFEVNDECLMLIALAIRHVEGVITLAKRDLVLLPAAWVMTRAAYEAGMRILWMLDPSDPFAREVRWLAHVKEGEQYYKRMAEQLDRLGADSAGMQSVYENIRDFRLAVEAKLPSPHSPLPKIPGPAKMLETMSGMQDKYVAYMVMSQYTHGTFVATELYRRHLGVAKELGEFTSVQDWYYCLQLCWYCLHAPGRRFLERNGGDVEAFLPTEYTLTVQEALVKVKTGPQ